MIQKLKGTRDILPGEIEKWKYVEETARSVMSSYGFDDIRVPVIESTELFLRGVGDTTDVVQKEMYIFDDKGGRSIALRPEGTAGVVRAYIENGLSSRPSPIKVSYIMPMYRYENVQKGRQREFNQIGVELFGASSYEADLEVILMALDLLKKLNITSVELNINSIGCKECRKNYQEALRNYIRPNLDKYCDTCKSRFEKNPMRILDCKEKVDKQMNENAPSILDYLCDDCKEHFEKLKTALDTLGIEYKIDPRIVRGLDYYTRTVFEIVSKTDGLTIVGGGRYDGMIEELRGPSTPAVGFAIGEERLLNVFDENNQGKIFESNLDLFIVTIGEKANTYAIKLLREIRNAGFRAEKDIMERSTKAQFKYSDKKKAKYTITIGDTEVESNTVKIKNMTTGTEEEVKIDEIINYIK